MYIEHRDCHSQLPTPIDKWLQAQVTQYRREDPCLISTNILCDDVSCRVMVETSPVSVTPFHHALDICEEPSTLLLK